MTAQSACAATSLQHIRVKGACSFLPQTTAWSGAGSSCRYARQVPNKPALVSLNSSYVPVLPRRPCMHCTLAAPPRPQSCPHTLHCTLHRLRCALYTHGGYRAEGACESGYTRADLSRVRCCICYHRGHLCCRGLPPSSAPLTCYNCGQSNHSGEQVRLPGPSINQSINQLHIHSIVLGVSWIWGSRCLSLGDGLVLISWRRFAACFTLQCS